MAPCLCATLIKYPISNEIKHTSNFDCFISLILGKKVVSIIRHMHCCTFHLGNHYIFAAQMLILM